MRLKGKVAVITGGEGPLGREVTKKFLAEGAKVVIGWFAAEEWEEAKKLIPGDYKEQFTDLRFDATKEDQVQSLMEKAKSTFGSIDILIHAVGMVYVGGMLWETDTAILERLIDVNLKSAFLCSKHALKSMLEKKSGRIVVFPPTVVNEPHPHFGAYALSKVGLVTLVNQLREELKDTNITVNAVMPSVMDTFRTRKMPNAAPDNWVQPSDVAAFLSFICSDEAKVLSGSILKVLGKV